MQATRRRDTSAEMRLRRALHSRGLRYRVDLAPLPGSRKRADIVFTRQRIAVLVHGCFWHGCPLHATTPKTNTDWWIDKLEANRGRDERAVRDLQEANWTVLVVWEHEDPDEAAECIERLVRERSPQPE